MDPDLDRLLQERILMRKPPTLPKGRVALGCFIISAPLLAGAVVLFLATWGILPPLAGWIALIAAPVLTFIAAVVCMFLPAPNNAGTTERSHDHD